MAEEENDALSFQGDEAITDPQPARAPVLFEPDLYDPDEPTTPSNFDLRRPTVRKINEAISWATNYYWERKRSPHDIWQCLIDDFADWNHNHFKRARKDNLRDFRDTLRAKGVYIRKEDRFPIVSAIMEAVYSPDFPAWPADDPERPPRSSTPPLGQPTTKPTAAPTREHYSSPQPEVVLIPKETESTTTVPSEGANTPPPGTPSLPGKERPKVSVPSSTGEVPPDLLRRLDSLTKSYHENDKFSGQDYDFLLTKVNLFIDKCQRIDYPRDQLARAVPVMLTGPAYRYYLNNLANKGKSYDDLITALQKRYETEAIRDRYLREWESLDLAEIVSSNRDKRLSVCLEILTEKIQLLHQGLFRPGDTGFNSMRDKLRLAASKVSACKVPLMKPAKTFEDLAAELQQAIAVHEQMKPQQADAFYTDRAFKRAGGNALNYQQRGKFQNHRKKCYVCRQPGCWSTRHSDQERYQARTSWLQKKHPTPPTTRRYQAFLTAYEGEEPDDEDAFLEQFYNSTSISEADSDGDGEEELAITGGNSMFATMGTFTQNFLATAATPQPTEVLAGLQDQAFKHALLAEDPYRVKDPKETAVFVSEERYSDHVFRGILPDTGAAGTSNAGMPQVRALMRIMPSLKIEEAPATTIHFGAGSTDSIGIVRVPTLFGNITFQVLPTATPFLFSITDMDKMHVRLDNLTNRLIQADLIVPVTRRWGHPWWLLEPAASAAFHLTETQLRQLHRRFGHPSVERLSRILTKVGQEFDSNLLKRLTDICHHCQLNAKAPGRFKFTIRDDHEFNHEIIVDIFFINGQPVLHVVDSATAFQAAKFLNNKEQKAKDLWDAIMTCWINTYLGPPEWIVHDAGKNFGSAEFKQYAKGLYIRVQEMPVEAHNSIGKAERYHGPLRRAYQIIDAELGNALTNDQKLQMAVKTINDTAGPDGLVPTLLVFGAYPRMTDDSPPSFNVVQRAEAIRKATSEARRALAKRQVRNALSTRNGPDTTPLHTLPLQSKVRVWREKNGWQGPFDLIAMEGETCTVANEAGIISKFRSTIVQPYLEDKDTILADNQPPQQQTASEGNADATNESNADVNQDGAAVDSIVVAVPAAMETPRQELPRRGPGRPRKRLIDEQYFFDALKDPSERTELLESITTMAFLTTKEQGDRDLAVLLRSKGLIITPGQPFEISGRTEIDNLIARGVFKFELYDPVKHAKLRIFDSRMVNEIKGKDTAAPYEKSRLVIRGYNDDGKAFILTQSPTIQRASQRLMIAIAPCLFQRGIILWIRDITQAYVQSQTPLQRTILARIPEQLRDRYPEGTIMTVIKPLYGIPEAGTHWWVTYSTHHRENLQMVTSTYDPCLLISGSDKFGIIGMQTDDTLGLTDLQFSDLEEEELQKAAFAAKPKEILTTENPLTFNGCRISLNAEGGIMMTQKGQASKLQIPTTNQEYIEQRARGAYLASICQPEAAFDLSIAAQRKEPTSDDFKRLGSRIQWQIDNQNRGLKYIPFDLEKAKLFVFVDGSFANNEDLSSQLGYIIVIGTEDQTDNDEFLVKGNIITYSSTKSKRVTRSALASELYSMVQGADIGYAIASTLKLITKQLGIPDIPMILLTDSYSLYECLVKLGTTKEKRLMIDIMALRRSYERREVHEVRWINGEDNPADAMTKASPNRALRTLIDKNKIAIRVEGWVERKKDEK
ncbi:Ribonuclease H-like protein [Metarhizium guizhouense ARSEF 977]|uniref:Ribonuclease H-like protein n=1 Tax=Metarhizium guizhouense (strain ARSEF 977) TaxID=1276136 RepID=A0A0B4HPJ3_METGA|nr:Ribonuclease H-like protein [Metarhizium guizhouense ARSEF 977]